MNAKRATALALKKKQQQALAKAKRSASTPAELTVSSIPSSPSTTVTMAVDSSTCNPTRPAVDEEKENLAQRSDASSNLLLSPIPSKKQRLLSSRLRIVENAEEPEEEAGTRGLEEGSFLDEVNMSDMSFSSLMDDSCSSLGMMSTCASETNLAANNDAATSSTALSLDEMMRHLC